MGSRGRQHGAWHDPCFVTEQGRVERTCRLVRGCGIRRNRMQHDPSDQSVDLAPVKSVSRRTMISLTTKFAVGVALAAVSSARTVPLAAAQDEIILTAAASEVGVKPGSAYARGAGAYVAGDQDAGATSQAGLTPTGAPPDSGGTPEAPSGDEDTSANEATARRGTSGGG